MPSPLRLGILGAGFMARMHGQRLLRQPDVALVALCDIVPAQAEALRQNLGVPGAALFTRWEEMLAEASLDALYVCLPPFAHGGEVEAAAARGLHVFVEKPIALDAAAARSMVAAVERAGVRSQVGYHLRFRRGVEQLREGLAEGWAGRPTLFQGRWFSNMDGNPWWRDRTRSGGQVYEQAIHLYDLALHFCGEPEQVTAHVARLGHQQTPGYTIEDTSAAVIRFRNGALATIAGSNLAVPDHYIGDFRMVADRALLDHRSAGDWRIVDEATLWRHGEGAPTRQDLVEDGDVYELETLDFLRAIRENRPTRTPLREGLRGILLVEAVLASAARGGEPVAVPVD